MNKKVHSYSAFYKGGKTQGYFQCLHNQERNTLKKIEGKLRTVYPQEERYGRKQWFAIVLDLAEFKSAPISATIFLDANSKRFFSVLYLIYEHWSELYGNEVFLEATPNNVRIGLAGQPALVLPKYNTIDYYGFDRAIFLIEQITGKKYSDSEQDLLEQEKHIRQLFTLDELKWLCRQQAKDENMELDDFIQNVLTLHFFERWSESARKAGYGTGPDAIMTMMKEEFGYETR